MIYLPRQRALFVHNPKVAGTAITAALVRAVPDAIKYWGRAYLSESDSVRDLAHLRAGEIGALLPADHAIDFSFGVVRDPYARFVSSWRHFNRYAGLGQPLTPDELIARYFNPTTLRSDWRFVHFCPQYSFFYDGARQCVSRVGRYESLGTFWHEIANRLDIPPELPHENVGDGSATELSPSVVAAINHYYARDFVLFGYETQVSAWHGPVAGASGPYGEFEGLWPECRGLDCRTQLQVESDKALPAESSRTVLAV